MRRCQERAPSAPIIASVVLEDWAEGNSNAVPGAASWDERVAGVMWANAGAGSPGSSSATAFNNWVTSSGAGVYGFVFDVATVQNWVSTPATNYGFISEGTSLKVISSSEASAVTARPSLEVVWLP